MVSLKVDGSLIADYFTAKVVQVQYPKFTSEFCGSKRGFDQASADRAGNICEHGRCPTLSQPREMQCGIFHCPPTRTRVSSPTPRWDDAVCSRSWWNSWRRSCPRRVRDDHLARVSGQDRIQPHTLSLGRGANRLAEKSSLSRRGPILISSHSLFINLKW